MSTVLTGRSSTGRSTTFDPSVARRRRVFGLLVVATVALVTTWLYRLIAADGLGLLEVFMLAAFLVTTPWIAIGFWNSVLGLWLLRRQDYVERVTPLQQPSPPRSLATRTAIVMPVCNEKPERVFRHLAAVADTLEPTGEAVSFDLFVLSDTCDPSIAHEEEARFELWRASAPRPERLHYRRRTDNQRHKVGNIREWCARWGERFDFMIVLDADSVMSGTKVVELAHTMEANPRLGILQTLAVGLPALSPFARIFQFGMRQGMRPYTVGSAWWQADCGPYWGHNAILRLPAFIAHCRLPDVPGRGPLAGEVLSHDQLEAVLMRRAGYEVRVLPVEGGSYEENPPTLPDFIKRELRWALGNLQYLRLLRLPGLLPLGRLQLALAALMYLAPFCWFVFMLFGFAQAAAVGLGLPVPQLVGPAETAFWRNVTVGQGVALFAVMMGMTFAPKIAGLVDVLSRRDARRRFGGGPRVLASGAIDFVTGALVAPVVSFAISVFVGGLVFGRRLRWDTQARDGHRIGWGAALRMMAPQTAFGLGAGAALAVWAPYVLPWAAPVLVGLVLAAPVASLTSRVALGRPLARLGLCAAPEEFAPPLEIRLLDLQVPSPAGAIRLMTRTAPTGLVPVPVRAQHDGVEREAA